MKRESTASNGDRVTSSEVIKAITSSPQDPSSFPATTTITSKRLIETTSTASPSTPLKTTETTKATIERSEHLTTAKLTTGSYYIESTVKSEVKPGESSTQTISTTSKDSSGQLTYQTTYLATTSPQSTSIQMTSGDASSTITITHNEDKSFTISGMKYSSTDFATSPFMQCVGMKSDRREFVEAVLLTIAHRDHQEKFEPRQALSSSSVNNSIGVSTPINFVPGDGAHCVSQTISGITQSTTFPNCGPKRRAYECVGEKIAPVTFTASDPSLTPVNTVPAPTPTPPPAPAGTISGAPYSDPPSASTPSPDPVSVSQAEKSLGTSEFIGIGVGGGLGALALCMGLCYYLNIRANNKLNPNALAPDNKAVEVRAAAATLAPDTTTGHGHADLVLATASNRGISNN